MEAPTEAAVRPTIPVEVTADELRNAPWEGVAFGALPGFLSIDIDMDFEEFAAVVIDMGRDLEMHERAAWADQAYAAMLAIEEVRNANGSYLAVGVHTLDDGTLATASVTLTAVPTGVPGELVLRGIGRIFDARLGEADELDVAEGTAVIADGVLKVEPVPGTPASLVDKEGLVSLRQIQIAIPHPDDEYAALWSLSTTCLEAGDFYRGLLEYAAYTTVFGPGLKAEAAVPPPPEGSVVANIANVLG
ncbi:hypothetical protein [Yinghuangia seranimata]|uniref:hypothetical protein n=1 Tax=Yinghuangia seranimata TaxID=408067 RepID=UPI00248B9157|nr:hypothetical protein [Yinghuangia seranimata]MDI2130277.1 hypothetical protein [Yinghuangia seranimata]